MNYLVGCGVFAAILLIFGAVYNSLVALRRRCDQAFHQFLFSWPSGLPCGNWEPLFPFSRRSIGWRPEPGILDRNRAGRTLSRGPVHFRAQTLRRRLVQHVQLAVITNLEHLGHHLHAEPVEVAYAQIDHDLHDVPRSKTRCCRAVLRRVYPTTDVSDVGDGQQLTQSIGALA